MSHLSRRQWLAGTAALLSAACSKSKNEASASTQAAASAAGSGAPSKEPLTLLNVSYDPTREFYTDYNTLFAKKWLAQTGQTVTLKQSHGGGGKQARAVMDGLQADVVTLALAYDIDVLAKKAKLIPDDWQKRLPNNSSPYTSTIVLLVRKGNPKGIKGWDDLVKPGIQVITPSPKTSGGARWSYLAAWGHALKKPGGTPESAKEFVRALYKNVPVLDSGARGATTTFVERKLGDALITWENEGLLATEELAKEGLELVHPALSILTEPPVTVVDKVVDKRGSRAAAEAYLKGLYEPDAQDIIGKHHFRPRDEAAFAKYANKFPKIELFTIDDVFGGWNKAQPEHFDEGGTFDAIYTPGK